MPDEQALSTQDVQDLQTISSHLPSGHPMQKKLSVLLNAQPTEFEKNHGGEGSNGGFLSGVSHAAGFDAPPPSYKDALEGGIPAIGAAKSLYGAIKNAPANFKAGGPAGVVGPLVGVDPVSMRDRAEHGDTAGILGEAAVPTAMALAPVAAEGAARGFNGARAAVSRAAYVDGQPKPAIASIGEALQHPTTIPGKLITSGAKTLFPPPPEFPGAALPAADEFYANRGEEINGMLGEQAKRDKLFTQQGKAVPLKNSPYATQHAASSAFDAGEPGPFTPISQSPVPQGNAMPFSGPRADFPKPIRPLVGTPEDWQVHDQQMGILRPEASDAGLYHAARGSASKKLNLQQRIGRKIVEE